MNSNAAKITKVHLWRIELLRRKVISSAKFSSGNYLTWVRLGYYGPASAPRQPSKPPHPSSPPTFLSLHRCFWHGSALWRRKPWQVLEGNYSYGLHALWLSRLTMPYFSLLQFEAPEIQNHQNQQYRGNALRNFHPSKKSRLFQLTPGKY